MLTTYLNSVPYPKFVLIQDTVEAKGRDILDYVVKTYSQRPDCKTHYFVFEGNFDRIKSNYSNVTCHDFASDIRDWLGGSRILSTELSNLNDSCVVIIDSLAHVLFRYEIAEAFRLLNDLVKSKTNVLQVVTVLHTDLLRDKDSVMQCFQHLASLHMEIEPKSQLSSPRILYTYRKGERKIIKQIEEYRFENGRFITEPIKKPDKQLIEETIQKVIPENMSTFKISLSDKDKESRSNLVLPYLPKDDGDNSGGTIHYTLDDVDDWDEEDPDDDLDI